MYKMLKLWCYLQGQLSRCGAYFNELKKFISEDIDKQLLGLTMVNSSNHFLIDHGQ